VIGRVLRYVGIGLAAAVLLFVGLVLVVGYVLSGPRHRGPVSDHFDGKRFRNLKDVPHGGFFPFLRWQRTRQPGPWSDRQLSPGPRPPARVGRGELRVTFVNHATVLVQMDGVNVLSDPIWSQRASPVSFVGPRRRHQPGLRFEDLPPIDAVVVSHAHYDHLDLATLKRLDAAHRPRFFVGLGNGELLRHEGISRVTELDWWQSDPLATAPAPEVRITGVPAQHFSNRGLFDRDATLWLGYVVQGPGGVVYLAGDTGAGPHFAEIRLRFGPPRLAVLPIGAYRPIWFMGPIHISPEEAVAAQKILGAQTSLGMHFGTFPLADDGQDEPVQALEAALARAAAADGGAAPRFWTLTPGEGRAVPPIAGQP
jgi:L-ascorbate metabolism protein UlaG (beta-lactamase superfamily)